MVFQSYALFPHMSVEKNVSYGLKLKKVPKDEISEKVHDMLALVGLEGYGDRQPHELSGGQQQRVQLARSLVLETDILLLDEPLASLDANLRKDMCFELKRIQEEVGITFIHVTHNQEEALTIADRIAIVADGKLIEEGTPKEIYERPRKKFTAEFIGENNLIEGTVVALSEDSVTVDVGCGSIAVDTPNIAPKPGDDVVISVPAEKIDLALEAPVGAVQMLEAVYQKETYSGFSSLHQLLLPNGIEFIAKTPQSDGQVKRAPGDAAWIYWPNSAARLHIS